MDASRLQELGVTHVLNVAAQAPPLHADKFVYLKVDSNPQCLQHILSAHTAVLAVHSQFLSI
jgi:hypothetical protein